MASGPNKFHEHSPRPRCIQGCAPDLKSHWVLWRTLKNFTSSSSTFELAGMSLTVRSMPSLGRWWLQARDHPQPPASKIPLTRKAPKSTAQKHWETSTFDSWDLLEFSVKQFQTFHEHDVRSHMSYDTSCLHGVALVGTDQKLTVELPDLRISFHAELRQLSDQNRPKQTKTDQNRPKQTKTDQNRPKRLSWAEHSWA